jgi:hypothetical protein
MRSRSLFSPGPRFGGCTFARKNGHEKAPQQGADAAGPLLAVKCSFNDGGGVWFRPSDGLAKLN